MSATEPLRHLRASTANKRPTPAAMADGQLALNTNNTSPGLFFKDSNGALVKVGPVHVGTTAPNASPAVGGSTGNAIGEQWLDTAGGTCVFKVWDGSAWRSESGTFVDVNGDVMTGALVMDNQQQVRFRETTANGTNFIAIQAPASVSADRTLTLPDVTGTLVSTGDTGSVTSTMIADGTIVNADINASAAIAGTKISPDFGSQNVTTTGTNTAASFTPTSSTVPTNGVYLPAANSVAISTGGSGRLFVDASGRVGVGSTSVPPALFCVSNGGAAGLEIEPNGADSGTYLQAYNRNSAIYTPITTFSSYFAIRTGASPTERARIDSSGRLLVGTSTSRSINGLQHVFQIEGTTMAGSSLSVINNTNDQNPPFLTLGKSKGGALGSVASVAADTGLGAIAFMGADGTNLLETATIKCFVDGTPGTNDMPTRLVFSTTADGASSPTERMRISQSGTVTIYGPGGGTFLNLSNSGGYSGLHEVDNTAYTIGQNSDLRAMRIGSGANWLTTGVSLAAGGTSWGTYSDERLKTDIVELTDCLDNIKGIRCVSYRLTDVDDVNSKKRIGVIAQDLVGKYDQAINASRRSENDETEYLSVQYSDLIPVLLKALQEASVKIESLESRLTAAGI